MLNVVLVIYAVLILIGKFLMNVEKLVEKKDSWLFIKYESVAYPEIGIAQLMETLSKGEIAIALVGAMICAALNVAFAYWLINLIF